MGDLINISPRWEMPPITKDYARMVVRQVREIADLTMAMHQQDGYGISTDGATRATGAFMAVADVLEYLIEHEKFADAES